MTRSSGGPIRILHVDDDPDFLEMTATFLEHETDRSTVVNERSARAGLERLSDEDIDCIVSDYEMAGRNGLEFLDAVREDYSDLPFILFTGKGSEEIAAEAISAGVTDYLQKESGTDQYAVLANSIENAVAQHQTEVELRRQREQYRRLLDHSPVPVVVYTHDAEIVYVNDVAVDFFDADEPADLLGTYATALTHPDDRGWAEQRTRRAVADREPLPPAEVQLLTLDDDTKHAIVASAPVSFDGEPAAHAVLKDITDRKHRERKLETAKEKFETVFEHTNDAIFISDIENDEIIDCNQAAAELAGTSREELRSMRPSDLHPHNQSAVKDWAETVFERGYGRTEDITCRRVDGQTIPVEMSAGVAEFDGQPCLVNNVRDITDRKERERELERYERIIENLPIGVYRNTPGPDGGFVEVNPAVAAIHGADSEAELREYTMSDLYADPEEREAFSRKLEREGIVRGEELNVTTVDGEPVRVAVTAIKVEEDGDTYFDGIVRDITDRKERERELERYETIVEALGDPVYALDGDDRLTYVNQAFEAMTDYPADELIGKDIMDVIDGANDFAGNSLTWQLIAADAAHTRFEATIATAGRKQIPCEINAGLLSLDDGGRGVAGVIRDISERKELEERLRDERDRFAALFENIPDPTVEYVFEGGEPVVERANAAFEETFGYSADQIQGDSLDSYIVPEDQVDEARTYNDSVATGQQLDVRVRRRTADGPREFILRSAPMDTDEVRGYSVYTDVTEQQRRKRELERQNERLDEFTSVVSHDLRNPLNVAEGSLKLLREECDSEHIDRIEDAHTRMKTLIEDLLDLARQGDTIIDTEVVEIARVATAAWDTVDTKQAELRVDGNAPCEADPSRLHQLFENLFRNAVEHAGSNTIVEVGALGDGSGFYVADDGSGIPNDRREQVFEPGHSTSDRGTGLGLAIVKRLAEAHGWDVSVAESDYEGARFEVTGVKIAESADV